MSETEPAITPDTKDWTWVLERPCPECGFVAEEPSRAEIGGRLRVATEVLADRLTHPTAATRPDPGSWSVLEYACHVRDVHRVFAERLHRMLTEDGPGFANWDQDATALAERYAEQDPAHVHGQLREAVAEVAAAYDALPVGDEATWARPGRRSNGSEFTVESLGRYHLHDVVHHAWDVTG